MDSVATKAFSSYCTLVRKSMDWLQIVMGVCTNAGTIAVALVFMAMLMGVLGFCPLFRKKGLVPVDASLELLYANSTSGVPVPAGLCWTSWTCMRPRTERFNPPTSQKVTALRCGTSRIAARSSEAPSFATALGSSTCAAERHKVFLPGKARSCN